MNQRKDPAVARASALKDIEDAFGQLQSARDNMRAASSAETQARNDVSEAEKRYAKSREAFDAAYPSASGKAAHR